MLAPLSFSATGGAGASDDILPGDGYWPDLTVGGLRRETGLADTVAQDRLLAALGLAVGIVQADLVGYRMDHPVMPLADVPHYRAAVYAIARGLMLSTQRDATTTRAGHDRMDSLQDAAGAWHAQARRSLALMCGVGAVAACLL